MFATLAGKVSKDKELPERAWRLDVLNRVLDGTLYDVLIRQFHEEKSGSGEYIPLRERAPSVRYNLCRLVVDDTTALVFGEGRFPAVVCKDKDAAEAFADLVAECQLPAVMHAASLRGSVGSVAVLFRVLEQRPFFDVLDTRFLTPKWKALAPDTLESVTERYRVRGSVLADLGYTIDENDLGAQFWFQRIWDESAETWFLPWRSDAEKRPPRVDPQRSVTHNLGFVPLAWIRNLPGGDAIDGACTFRQAVDTAIEIDYQLSQAGRGLKYSSDPLLMIREPAADDESIVRSAGNALVVSEKGDAKLLEIGGTAASAVIEYVRFLRELALESLHGNRSNADKVSAAQSGRALELLHQPLVQLADVLRTSYGVNGLLPLLRMVALASEKMPIRLRERTLRHMNTAGLTLRWPEWFDATEPDKQAQASTLSTLRSAGMISRETAIRVIGPSYDIEDAAGEMAKIAADEAAADARELAQAAAQTKITETAPG